MKGKAKRILVVVAKGAPSCEWPTENMLMESLLGVVMVVGRGWVRKCGRISVLKMTQK